MMQDLVDPTSCGVANPLANLGALGQNEQAAQARAYGADPSKASAIGSVPMGAPTMMDQMHGGPMGADLQAIEAFQRQFEGRPGMPPEQMMMQQMMIPQGPAMDPNALVNEFGRMNMEKNMVAEFERMYTEQKTNMGAQWAQQMGQMGQASAPQMPGVRQAWAAEFAQAQVMPQYSQQHQQYQASAARMNQMSMMGGGMPMMGMGMQMPMMGMGMGMHGMQVPMAPMASTTTNISESMQTNVAETKIVEETQVKESPAEPVLLEGLEEQSSAMGMGMSAEMIENLMNSDKDKWRNSKFLKFINKIQKGEIEFKDNQAIEKVPSTTEVCLLFLKSQLNAFIPLRLPRYVSRVMIQ